MLVGIGLWLWRALIIIVWLIASASAYALSDEKAIFAVVEVVVTIWFALLLLAPNILYQIFH